jgi:hypothetical protein
MSQGILQQDGTRCYSGPSCKLHGATNQEIILKTRINALFTKNRKRFDFPERDIHTEYLEDNKKIKRPSREQNKVIKHYTSSGYNEINAQLRGNSKDRKIAKQISILDNFIENNKVPMKGVLYRGLGLSPEREKEYNRLLQVDEVYQDKAFFSTTINLKQAVRFASMRPNRKKILFRISVKEATPVSNQTNYEDPLEHEYLLERNKQFKVVSIKRNVIASSYSNWDTGVKKPSITIVDLEEI